MAHKNTGLFLVRSKCPPFGWLRVSYTWSSPSLQDAGWQSAIIWSFACYSSRGKRDRESPPGRDIAQCLHLVDQSRSHDQAYCPGGRDVCPSVSHTDSKWTRLWAEILSTPSTDDQGKIFKSIKIYSLLSETNLSWKKKRNSSFIQHIFTVL